MRNGASTYVTAQFISAILAARPTAVGEVAQTFSVVADTISRLLQTEEPRALARPAVQEHASRLRRPRAVAAPEQPAADIAKRDVQAVVNREEAVASAPPVVVIAPKRRGRPPRSALAPVASAPEPVETAIPVSRLLRRNAVAAPTHAAAPVDPFDRDPHAESRVKGVVKWFDSRSNKGVLRLTGMAGDVALDAGLLSKSKIKRLYKDQEVEVTGAFLDGKFEPRGITVPGQAQEALITKGHVLHAAGRQSRPVYVEVKRANPRLQSARAEAEHALGRVGSKSGL